MSEHIAQTLLRQAHPPDVAAAVFTDKVLNKPLHLRPTSSDPTSQDARAQRRLERLRKTERSRRRRKPKPLSAKERRMTGIYDIPDSARRYEIYEPLHRMWIGYMWEILGMKIGDHSFVTAQAAGSKLASADFHGADILVVRSRCVGMVGLEGIVVRDTKFTFQFITKKHEIKTIPKRHTVFRFDIPQPDVEKNTTTETSEKAETEDQSQLPHLVFELQGSQFELRPTDRATKKFKPRNLTDL